MQAIQSPGQSVADVGADGRRGVEAVQSLQSGVVIERQRTDHVRIARR